MARRSRSIERRLRGLSVWEEEDEAAAVVAQRRNGSGNGLANPLLRGAINSLIRTVHCPLQKVTYAPHDPQSTCHRLRGIPGRQPKALPVGRHVDLQA